MAAADLITLTATITDNDGDEASATHDIGQSLNFEDDGPTMTADGVVPELTVDETDLHERCQRQLRGRLHLGCRCRW